MSLRRKKHQDNRRLGGGGGENGFNMLCKSTRAITIPDFCQPDLNFHLSFISSQAFDTSLSLSCMQISADPADINILPGYDKDPRVVENLIDGINRTR